MTLNKSMSRRCIVSRNNITRISYSVIVDMSCGKCCHWEHHAKDKHQGKYEWYFLYIIFSQDRPPCYEYNTFIPPQNSILHWIHLHFNDIQRMFSCQENISHQKHLYATLSDSVKAFFVFLPFTIYVYAKWILWHLFSNFEKILWKGAHWPFSKAGD